MTDVYATRWLTRKAESSASVTGSVNHPPTNGSSEGCKRFWLAPIKCTWLRLQQTLLWSDDPLLTHSDPAGSLWLCFYFVLFCFQSHKVLLESAQTNHAVQLYIHSILEYYNTYYSRGNKFLDALKFATTQTLKQRARNYFVIYCLYNFFFFFKLHYCSSPCTLRQTALGDLRLILCDVSM